MKLFSIRTWYKTHQVQLHNRYFTRDLEYANLYLLQEGKTHYQKDCLGIFTKLYLMVMLPFCSSKFCGVTTLLALAPISIFIWSGGTCLGSIFNLNSFAWKLIVLDMNSLNYITVCKVFANGPGDWGLISGRIKPKTQKIILVPPCLTFSIIKYGSKVSGTI